MRNITAILSVCCLLLMTGCQESASIGIIGGADGPTSIIVASAPSSGWVWALAAGIIAAVIIAAVVIKKRNK